MGNYLFFDNASTTRCCKAACELIRQFTDEEFGNPSSSHVLGQHAATAIRSARAFFAGLFHVKPEQIIFTGSGSESDNLAVYGIAMAALARRHASGGTGPMPRVITTPTEHAAVRKTAQSLSALGVDVKIVPVDARCQVIESELVKLLTPETVLVSVQQVNNIAGCVLPVEKLASLVKGIVPTAYFHTDAVQAFGKIDVPRAGSPVDLVSISAHKIEGPKGVGALIVLNENLMKSGLRPVIWGGEQEAGFRSGTQNAGLIAGFHAAAEQTFAKRSETTAKMRSLQKHFRDALVKRALLGPRGEPAKLVWNSPPDAVPHIISLSIPGYPASTLAKMLEERGCLVSTGSACSSHKVEPDPVLNAMGLSPEVKNSALRVSFGNCNRPEDIDVLTQAIAESIATIEKLLGGSTPT